ncbi:MAG: pseudouridine-5'-phosphate glycosidase [Gammaproteobacteria bacterium]|nr:pseudouridine-5'-phosphate glycosidase [Gammaproteobacteria bacterium]
MPASTVIAPDVQNALANQRPVVALESTIITHGMPFPTNVETALEVQNAVRSTGATPATIAVMEGVLRIGLSDTDIEQIAQQESVMKLSRADLAMAISTKAYGSTTVAATMIAAQLAGIPVFATGGIGGVHRGADTTWDISADLTELGKTNVAVVCAGPKAILDIPKTLEVLETLGVPVVTYGQTHLPAFWSKDSDILSPLSVHTLAELVAFIRSRQELALDGGVLIANPVPQAVEIPYQEITQTIEQAIGESQHANVTGKAVTPWLLERMEQLTQGRSLSTNKALIINNAVLAGKLAKALARYGFSEDL